MAHTCPKFMGLPPSWELSLQVKPINENLLHVQVHLHANQKSFSFHGFYTGTRFETALNNSGMAY